MAAPPTAAATATAGQEDGCAQNPATPSANGPVVSPSAGTSTGHIAAVGEGVDARCVPEPVTALITSGAYAEVVLAPVTLTFGIGIMPLRTAAGLGRGVPTAYDLINTAARVRPGESVLSTPLSAQSVRSPPSSPTGWSRSAQPRAAARPSPKTLLDHQIGQTAEMRLEGRAGAPGGCL
ncbi:hypothetical protein ACIRUL_19405 [Streptomyces sp. NPDC101171]|uniref:hypothetical protein n=1 Tax=Streptomyces sp. NPDC101171 TaxID=3366122 RepID=UPI0038083B04